MEDHYDVYDRLIEKSTNELKIIDRLKECLDKVESLFESGELNKDDAHELLSLINDALDLLD